MAGVRHGLSRRHGRHHSRHKDIFIPLSRIWQDRPWGGQGPRSRSRARRTTITRRTRMSPSDIRPGEVAVPLPEHFDAQLYFIGRIRTPWTRREDCPKNARESDALCTLLVDERWATALTGVETCSHLVVLYWISRPRRDLVLQMPRHYAAGPGTVPLRSPALPN